MSIRNLHDLFAPKSVVLIGASDRPHSVGATVLRNLIGGRSGAELAGRVMAINPHHSALMGLPVYPDIDSLPVVPQLAVIATPPATVREFRFASAMMQRHGRICCACSDPIVWAYWYPV